MLIYFRKSLFGLLVFIFVAISPGLLYAQTCSCAGAPLLGSQSSGAAGAGNLLIGVTYEFNQITRLFSGNDMLVNDSAERSTQSTLIEINYGITDRFSVSGTISYVDKERISGLSNPLGTQVSQTNGIGDGMILLRYNVLQQTLWNRYHLAVGGGVKAPFGSTSFRNNNGLLFNSDMQPGTGAWDGVFWSHASVALIPFTSANLSLTTSYRLTGTNERFSQNDNYQFGNELVSTLSVSNGITERIGYRLGLRYRSTTSDELNNVSQPNTGGKWVFIYPELSFALSDRFSIGAGGQLPLWQYLKGTQPTTTFTASASLFINFNRSENTFIHGKNR
jgi:hypothetical protein